MATKRLVRQAMSYEEYERLPEQLCAEWVVTEAVIAPPRSVAHQQAARRLANLLEATLPELLVVEAITLILTPRVKERIPKAVVVTQEPTGPVTETLVIAVEVLSPGIDPRSEPAASKAGSLFGSCAHTCRRVLARAFATRFIATGFSAFRVRHTVAGYATRSRSGPWRSAACRCRRSPHRPRQARSPDRPILT